MRAVIHWFIDNPVAANLLMFVIIVSGYFYFSAVGKEVFPRSDFGNIIISAAYPGASPLEVEQQVIVRIEEAIADLEGIEAIKSTARESQARTTIEVIKDFDIQSLLNNVQTRIDALTTLPDEVDDIEVVESATQRRSLMTVAIYGNVDEGILKETTQWLQRELLRQDAVSSIDIEGTRDREMTIAVSEQSLRNYGLTFSEIASAIRRHSINLPAGTIKNDAGAFQVQTRGQAYTEQDFANIVIAVGDNAAELTLGQLASITDGFAEKDQRGNYNGYPASYLTLFTSTPPDIVNAADNTRARLEQLRTQLPPGLQIDVWFDWSLIYKSRMNLLLENTLTGLIFVFILLMLFLRPFLAMWVSIGIATAFLGVFWVLPFTGVTLNMLSMYGFLLALGIVVDDAIVVGESIYAAQRRGHNGIKAAKKGVSSVSKPVVFAVVSTMIFFSAMFGLEGQSAVLAVPIATVVIVCLLFSLIECLLILPSHLSSIKPEVLPKNPGILQRVRLRLSAGMENFANNHYQRFLAYTLNANGKTLTVFLLALVIVLCLYLFGGYLKKSFRPIITSSEAKMTAVLPEGAAFSDVKRIQDQIEQAAYQLKTDETLLAINANKPFVRAIRSIAVDNRVVVRVRLFASGDGRKVNIIQAKDRWQDIIGPLTGVQEFNVDFTINPGAKDLRFLISLPGNNAQQIASAITDIRTALSRYQSVYQIEHTLEGARTEIELRLKPYANVLGLSLADIARQIRQGFYGEEVQRIPRGSDDIKVMLRYPVEDRRSVDTIRQMYVRSADNRFVPLNEVAELVEVPGYTKIDREDRRRTIALTAQVEKGVDTLALANGFVEQNFEQWQQAYPGLLIEIAGAVADEKEFNTLIFKNFVIAFTVSFGLMAIIFRSYWQPILILTAIPFGFVGAVLGHLIMNQTVTMNSMLGFVACAGVVVNDNLVLLDRIHRLREQGHSVTQAITQAGADRFRAIILTSLTTFVGLLPILFETSIQAQFLIPMVISLAFGVLFATVVTLIFVPNLYLLGERCRLMLRTRLARFKSLFQ
ncbi:MAG: efflux RND transporter permease subunit [Pseudomonadota bacterium]